jgi:hypothetical protein
MRIMFHLASIADDGPGHEQDMGIDTTFGEAIHPFCTQIGVRARDWTFSWASLNWEHGWIRQQRRTPHELGLTDDDEVFVLCVPRDVNN